MLALFAWGTIVKEGLGLTIKNKTFLNDSCFPNVFFQIKKSSIGAVIVVQVYIGTVVVGIVKSVKKGYNSAVAAFTVLG